MDKPDAATLDARLDEGDQRPPGAWRGSQQMSRQPVSAEMGAIQQAAPRSPGRASA